MSLIKLENSKNKKHIFICNHTKTSNSTSSGCGVNHSEELFSYLKSEILKQGLTNTKVSKSSCLGRCNKGPSLIIYPDNQCYHFDNKADIDELINILLDKKFSESSVQSKDQNVNLDDTILKTNILKTNIEKKDEFYIHLTLSGDKFKVPKNKSILDVLLEHDYEIPYSCKQGLCGKCQIKALKAESEINLLNLNPSPHKIINTCVHRDSKNKIVNLLI